MYKMVLKITKETQEKYGIKTVKYYKISKYCGKKQNTSQKKKKKNENHFLKVKKVFSLLKKLTHDIIERCKLPEVIELRKKLGYNHDDIMVQEETSIAEKMIKVFSNENIALNKKFNNRKPDIWFKNHNLIEIDEGNHENYDSDDEKEREDIFKKHNFKTFRCNPNDPEFDLFTFLGEMNLYISKLREKKQQIK